MSEKRSRGYFEARFHLLMRSLRRADPYGVERLFSAGLFVISSLILTVGSGFDAKKIFGLIGLCLLAGLLFATYIWHTHREFLRQPKNVIVSGFALIAFLVTYRIFGNLYWFLIPVSTLALLLTSLLGHRVALIQTVLVVAIVTLAAGSGPAQATFLLVSGLLAIMVGRRNSDWRQMARSGAILIMTMAFAGAAVGMATDMSWAHVVRMVGEGAANGLEALILVLGTMPILESALNLATPGRLMDLTDVNRGLLKKMQTVAPGTYSHSLMVGSMAQSAAEAIGAHGLLARVAAYYHDVGKLKRPNFFIENQLLAENPHDFIDPRMSWLTINSHVKDGAEMAEEERLPREIVDIIRQHHGDSVVSYFYNKALVSARKKDVTPDDYRYDGEKPQTREAALVMICDSVEAGLKGIEKPTMNHARALVKNVIKCRMEDGQFDYSGLTFHDLNCAQDALENFLSGLVTTRVADHPETNEVKREVDAEAVDA